MSNQEPDGWYFDAKNVRHFHSQFEVARIGSLCAGTTPVPFNSIDPQELTRLRLIEQGFNKIHRHMLEQADDEALWLDAESVVEHYILQELRKLHQTIEQASDAITEAKPEPKMHTDAFGQPLIGRAKA
ncbi:MAG TPA: hypothetical protein PK583_00080 [Gammaproteobacteria bacterium]|nr:hypothetical protein [Gammaproteobacteria bacterium]